MKSCHYLSTAVFLTLALGINTQAPLELNTTHTFPENQFQDEGEFRDIYQNVLSIRFHLRSQRISELLTKFALQEMQCPIKQCNVSLIDIVNAIQLDTFTNANIASAIEKMNISGRDAYNMFLIYNVSTTLIENLLTKAGTSFSELYKNFVESLFNPVDTIPNILTILNVSVFDFMNAQAYGNDSSKLLVLSTGNYSYENVQAVLNATNKTAIDILEVLPLNIIAKHLHNFSSAAFTNFAKNLGLTSAKLLQFYSSLNVTSINFIAYHGFQDILTDLDLHLNPEEVLATAVSKTTLVTSNDAKSLKTFQTQNYYFIRNYTYFQAENIPNPLIHYHIKNVLLKNPEYVSDDVALIELFNSYTGNITEVATTFNSSKLLNCTYVTKLGFGEYHIEVFPSLNLIGHIISVEKTNATIYNLGSPLFCENKLVGIASKNSSNEIQFLTFKKKVDETSKPPGGQTSSVDATTPKSVTGSDETAASSKITLSFVCGIIMLIEVFCLI